MRLTTAALWVPALLLNSIALAGPPGGEWSLTFEDEFNSKVLDSSKWNIRTGVRRDAYWDKAGVITKGDGTLEISTLAVENKVVSGSIDTKAKFEQRFGYFETRCRLPRVPGHWSAFWILSREFGTTDNAKLSGAEVDIFEYHTVLGANVHHAVHWPRYGPTLQSSKMKSPLASDGKFHTFGLLWEKTRYVFFVDGAVVWETTDGVSEVAQYLLLTNEVGAWAGALNLRDLPDGMSCDYVRAYKRISPIIN